MSTRRTVVHTLAGILLILGLLVGFAPDSLAQGRNDVLEAAFGDVAAPASAYVVRLVVQGGAAGQTAYGVVLDPTIVVTTSRAVEGATRISVEVGGRQRTATVLGRHGGYNIAALRVDGLTAPIPQGSSASLVAGQWVISVTTDPTPAGVGIVSANGRRVEQREGPSMGALDMFGLLGDENQGPDQDYPSVIQHDAPVDSSELGSALVDSEGRLVGLNVGRAYRGTTFAVGIDDIRRILPDLVAGRSVAATTRGYVGIQVAPVPPEEREAAGGGARIAAVVDGSPAAAGGLQAGDVIVSVGGNPCPTPEDVSRQVGEVGPGAALEFVVRRDGRLVTLTVTTGARPRQ